MLQLVYVFQRAIELTHRNIYPMLPTALETDGTCLTRTSPSTPDCKAACLVFERSSTANPPDQTLRGYLQTH